jgi:hypothetical protein
MNHEFCVKKAKTLLAPNGVLLVVGCANPSGFFDYFIEVCRVLPARIGSMLHGEGGNGSTGMVTTKPSVCLADIRKLAAVELPGAKIRLGLYYRYLLSWVNKTK